MGIFWYVLQTNCNQTAHAGRSTDQPAGEHRASTADRPGQARALEAEAGGEHARAADLHAVAAAGWERFTNVFEQAHSLLGQGRCLARLEDPAADEPLSRALALFTDMGATARVADCDSLIAQASRLSS